MAANGARVLSMHDIQKRFGAVQALRGVSLALAPGEVHALIGENGAGKSTLMKVLSGAHAPDGGHMELGGQPYAPRGPAEARAGRGHDLPGADARPGAEHRAEPDLGARAAPHRPGRSA